MKVIAAVLTGLMLLGAQCNPPPNPPSATGGYGPIPWNTGGSSTGGSIAVGDLCDQAYEHSVNLGCPLKSPKTGSWSDACKNLKAHALDAQDDCVVKASDCRLVNRCMEVSP